jgi:hypothetical protein
MDLTWTTEVTIEGEKNPTLVMGFLKHLGVGSAPSVLSDRMDVQTVLLEQQDGGPGNVLVGQKPGHAAPRSTG